MSDLPTLEATYRRLIAEAATLKRQIETGDHTGDVFVVERKYNRLHKKLQAARVAYLEAGGQPLR